MAQPPKKKVEPPAKANPGDNVANRYFSVSVTPTSLPSSLLSLPLGEGASDTESYNYLRLGAPDGKFEGRLPPNPEEPNEKGESETSPWEDGLLLYTTGKYQVVAPSTSEATAESLDVVHDGKVLYSAEYIASADIPSYVTAGLGAINVAYKHLNELTSHFGTSVAATLGAEQTFWTGISTKFGIGSELTGTLGTHIHMAAAKEAHIGPHGFEIHGSGHEAATKTHNIFSTGAIRLSSNPAGNAHVPNMVEKVRNMFNRAATVAAVVAAASTTLISVAPFQNIGVWAGTESDDDLKKSMIATAAELTAVMALFTILQVLGTIALLLTKFVHTPAAIAEGVEDPTSAILMLQKEGVGSSSYLKAGMRELMFGQFNEIRIANGQPGPRITVTNESITLSVGASSVAISATGITMSAPEIACIGGEASALGLNSAGAILAGPNVQMLPANPGADAQAAALAAEIAAQAALAAEETESLATLEALEWLTNFA